MNRSDRRSPNTLRPIQITRQYTKYAPGSVLVCFGDTKVICTACIEEKVPPFMRDSGKGWITAEYAMLPGATNSRYQREVNKGKPSGRTNEIQRLIGRSLRSVVDMSMLGERTIHIDADVIQADGGTRTAAITGGMVAMWDAVKYLQQNGKLRQNPIRELLAAVSIGVVNDTVLLDLCYEEDCVAEVDMNIVMTESGQFVEIQGTAEQRPFSADQLASMLSVSGAGIKEILGTMKESIFESITTRA